MQAGETKFDMGQEVWVVHTNQTSKHVDCENCHGHPKQFVRWASGVQQEVVCQNCHGSGKGWKVLETVKTDAVWLRGTVCGVEVNMPGHWGSWGANKRKEREVMYRLKDIEWLDPLDTEHSSNIFYEEQMYARLVDAEAACRGANDGRKLAA